MISAIRIWVVVVVIGVGCIGAAGLYGPYLAKTMLPQFFVMRAVVNLTQEIGVNAETLQVIPVMAEEIRNESWRQELTLRIDQLEVDILPNIDPAILSVAEVLSFRNISRWDSNREAFAAELAVQMAVTTVASADLYLDRELIAVYIPMLFDFSIMVDPRRLGSEWDDSIFGNVLSPDLMEDELFYQMYEEMLFDPREEIDFEEFVNSLAGLAMYVEFEYAGRQNFNDTDQIVDVFHLTVPENYIRDIVGIVIQDARFTDDLALVLYINGNQLLGMDFVARLNIDNSQFVKSGFLHFLEAGRIQFEVILLEGIRSMQSANGYLVFEGGSRYQSVSFDVNLIGNRYPASSLLTTPSTVSADGRVRLFPQDKRIEADINNLSLVWQDNYVSVNIRYQLQIRDEAVIFDKNNARLLTDLNLFDLLGLYARFGSSPLGGVIGNLLP